MKASYDFKVKVTAEGGREHWAYVGSSSDTTLTLDIGCGETSTIVTESSYASIANTDTQYVEKNSASLTKFVMP